MALALTFLEFGTHVVVFFVLRETSGLQFGIPGAILAPVGLRLRVFLALCGVAPNP